MRLLLVFISFSFVGWGQQVPQYTQWMHHQFLGNPAHAGLKKCVDLHTGYRIQWVGFQGAPHGGFVTASFGLNTRRKKVFSARHGVGIRLERDVIGPFSVNKANLAYATHINFSEENRLSVGISAGFIQGSYDPSLVTTGTPDAVLSRTSGFVLPDASLGAWFNSTDFFVGLSLNNLIPVKWNPVGTNSKYRFYGMLTGGYRWSPNERFALLPTLNLRTTFRGPISADLNLNVDFQNKFRIGAGFRFGDAVLVMAQYNIKEQFAIGYSYDITVSPLRKASSNTHEITLRFTTCKPNKKSDVSCPLFE